MGLMVSATAKHRDRDLGEIFAEINSGDLNAIVSRSQGPADRQRYRCPFKTHSANHLSVKDVAGKKIWKCFACEGAPSGSIIDWYVQVLGHADSVAVARHLGYLGQTAGSTKPTPRPLPPPSAPLAEPIRAEAWQDPEWQAEIQRVQKLAEKDLWNPKVGKDALAWLRARGFIDATIKRFRLGFVPRTLWTDKLAIGTDEHGKPKLFPIPRGITIPWAAPNSSYLEPRPTTAGEVPHPDDDPPGEKPTWVGVNIRRLAADVFGPLEDHYGKCQSIKGSVPGYGYPWPTIDPSQGNPPAFICEGEIDALLAEQHFGHIAFVTTTGGAKQRPRKSLLDALENCPRWLLALDNDRDGIQAANRWRGDSRNRAGGECYRLLLPDDVKDLGDMIASKQDPVQWLNSQLAEIDGGGDDVERDSR
jgi:hypothetical protein